MTRSEATKALWNILIKIGIFVVPPSAVAAIVTFLLENKVYTTISVIITVFVIYIIWIELRLRKLEDNG